MPIRAPSTPCIRLCGTWQTPARTRCRWVDAEASDEEILYFLEFTIASLRHRSMVDDAWREQLIAEVPRRFTNQILIERYRLEHPR